MSRYGQVRDLKMSAEDFRVESLLLQLDRDFGNCGVDNRFRKFLEDNEAEIQDAFTDDDTIHILPGSKEFAARLYVAALGKAAEDPDELAIADEVDWVKLGKRYWLRLWFD